VYLWELVKPPHNTLEDINMDPIKEKLLQYKQNLNTLEEQNTLDAQITS
jgi:hypothetical protein